MRGASRAVAALAAMIASATLAQADPRPFTYTYDLYPAGKGRLELEQWATWKQGPGAEPGADRFEFRQELEVGVTDTFDLAVYLPNWHIEDTETGNLTKLDSIGVEGILYLSSPVTAPLGVGLYFEASAGPAEIALEPKLILQKDIGQWTIAYNLIAETEIEREDGEDEVTGVFGNALGASWAAGKAWQLGAEIFSESVYDGWHRYEGTTVYAGPAVSFRPGTIGANGPGWWATLTPNWQLSHRDDEPGFQVRLVAGLEF